MPEYRDGNSKGSRAGLGTGVCRLLQWRKCDAPAAPRWLEPHLVAGCPGAQVPWYTGAALRCQAVVAFCAGRKDQAEIVDMSGPSRRFLHYKALPPKPPTSGASVIFLRPSLSHSHSIPRIITTPRPHPHTHKHTPQQAASSADTSDLITSYEPLWCRLVPSYECLLVGLRPSSSNPPVQMTWPSGRGLLPSSETDSATWYGPDRLRNLGLSGMALLT